MALEFGFYQVSRCRRPPAGWQLGAGAGGGVVLSLGHQQAVNLRAWAAF